MSGTSLDGIDAALVAFQESKFELISSYFHPYSAEFQEELRAVCFAETVNLKALAKLDADLGIQFANTVVELLRKSSFDHSKVKAIGSHGQTIYHSPNTQPSNTLQIGDPNRIAEITGISTISDFRRKDMAVGGQGAPLVPGFHRALFQDSNETRVIVNIGGIANITVLARQPDQEILGFDVGPGNGLMDDWALLHLGQPFDEGGKWAKSGKLNSNLLGEFKDDPYFAAPPPKSTGKEYFSLNWLNSKLQRFGQPIKPEDVQHTLSRLTAELIVDAIIKSNVSPDRVLVCGGGIHNQFLMENLNDCANCRVESTLKYGVDPDWVEAGAFAWLAKQRIEGLPGNIPTVTGASRSMVLGSIYQGG